MHVHYSYCTIQGWVVYGPLVILHLANIERIPDMPRLSRFSSQIQEILSIRKGRKSHSNQRRRTPMLWSAETECNDALCDRTTAQASARCRLTSSNQSNGFTAGYTSIFDCLIASRKKIHVLAYANATIFRRSAFSLAIFQTFYSKNFQPPVIQELLLVL